jgi:hypothetical protein
MPKIKLTFGKYAIVDAAVEADRRRKAETALANYEREFELTVPIEQREEVLTHITAILFARAKADAK